MIHVLKDRVIFWSLITGECCYHNLNTKYIQHIFVKERT